MRAVADSPTVVTAATTGAAPSVSKPSMAASSESTPVWSASTSGCSSSLAEAPNASRSVLTWSTAAVRPLVPSATTSMSSSAATDDCSASASAQVSATVVVGASVWWSGPPWSRSRTHCRRCTMPGGARWLPSPRALGRRGRAAGGMSLLWLRSFLSPSGWVDPMSSAGGRVPMAPYLSPRFVASDRVRRVLVSPGQGPAGRDGTSSTHLRIFEGTEQIELLVISRAISRLRIESIGRLRRPTKIYTSPCEGTEQIQLLVISRAISGLRIE